MKRKTTKAIMRIFYMSLIVNIILSIIKLTFGYLYKSTSLTSDGINSLTDIIVSLGLIISMKIATKEPDFNHPYGHQKYEGITFLLLGLIIGFTGFFIGYNGVIMLINDEVSNPSFGAVIVAVIALCLKLFIAGINYFASKKYNSPTLKADSINHLTDSVVSFLVLVSVVLYQITEINIESIVSIIVGLFVVKTSFELIAEAFSYLVDEVPSIEVFDKIKKEILSVTGVIQIDDLKMRKHVNYIYVDVEISVNEKLSLKAAHDISENVHDHIEKKFKEVLHIMVHVNPIKENHMEYFKLHNGILIPVIGMGANTFGKENHDFYGQINMDTKEIHLAYKNGYRLIDTAIMYRNENVIGASIKETNLSREDLFITSKISTKDLDFNNLEDVRNKIETSIVNIGSYIDLYLIHHPSSNEDNLMLWNLLIEYYLDNKFKAIGVSNFNEEQLAYLIENSKIKPMINQIESNPNCWNHEIIKYCIKNDIIPQAWGPLDPVPNKEVLIEIGKKYNKSWAQVLLKYQIQRGVVVIPKSHNDMRQQENINIFDFRLTQEDIQKIEN